jgi:signal peptidase I
MNFAASFYRLMLYAYPGQFRREYGSEMQRLFIEQYRDAAKMGSRERMARFYGIIASDWMRSAMRERFDALKTFFSIARASAPRGAINEWIVTILMYLFASTTLVQAYVIPTGSMEGNLRVGDHMLVDKTAYGKPGVLGKYVMPYREIQRGDIVAFLYPEDTHQTYVKRVIGLPGDRIHLAGKQVIRNGRVLLEPYTRHVDPSLDPDRDNFPIAPDRLTTPRGLDMFAHHMLEGDIVVPPGMLFVLGDNRDNSLDSRYWGFVPREYVVGKPLFVYWSYDAPTEDLMSWSLPHLADVAEHFFTKTRWERTFLVPRSQAAQEESGQ